MRPELTGTTLIFFLCFIGFGVLLVTAVAAVILRWAVSLHNAIAASSPETLVPSPGMGLAMVIVFIRYVLQVGVSMAMQFAGGMNPLAMDRPGASMLTEAQVESYLVTWLITLPVSFIVGSALLSSLLPTSFGRACLVSLLECVIVFVIGFVLGALGVVLVALSAVK
jgi:hypothetical protein